MAHIKVLWLAIPCCACILFGGCNTTESEFYVGSLSDVKLTTDPVVTQLRLTADGSPQQIHVQSNVSWELIPPSSPFSATADNTQGDGVITVTAALNANSADTPVGTLTIQAIDFNKEISVSLIQQRLQFSMDRPEVATMPQEGGSVDLTFDSSIDWQFVAEKGSLNWLIFSPASSGSGDWDKITVKAEWTPNYSTVEREIELQLQPQDEANWRPLGLQPLAPFTLKQEAGTLPEGVSLMAGSVTRESVNLLLNYSSKAPVDKVEVKVDNLATGATSNFSVPTGGQESYPLTGAINFEIGNLDAGTSYNLTPMVTSKVGQTNGEPIRIQTYGDVNFEGPILKTHNITPLVTGVNAEFVVESDIEMTSMEISLCDKNGNVLSTQTADIRTVLDASQSPVAWTGELVWRNDVVLAQNTEYYFTVSVKANNPNTPDKLDTVIPNYGTFPFTTLYRLPGQDDNHPIN